MSTPEHDSTPTRLQADIEAALSGYTAARETLAPTLAGLFAQADDTADALLSTADECGAAEAIRQLRQTPEAFGDRSDTAAIDDDTAQALETRLEAILDARDRLDVALSRHHAHAQADLVAPPQRIHVDGRIMTIDRSGTRMTAVDEPRVSHPLDATPRGGRDMTLTEEARYRAGVDRAEPKLQDRSRDRTR